MQSQSIAVRGPVPTVPVLGVRVGALDLERATTEILGWIERGERHYVSVTGVHGIMEAQDDPAFRGILNGDLVVPDGMPLVWLCKLAGETQTDRVYGPDLTLWVSRTLAERGLSAFYYGAAEGVAAELARVLEERFAGLGTAGTFSPPFRELTATEEEAIVDRINASGAAVVWVGLSTPKQERWMARMRGRLTPPVLIGVGAAFDFHTGRVRQAPRLVQRSGLEWLFRLAMEPRRLWRRYLRNNPRFLWLLVQRRWGRPHFR